MPVLNDSQFKNIAFWGMALIAIGLPISLFLMSLGSIVLTVNWLLQKDYKKRLTQFFKDPIGLVFSLFFFLHVIGMAWTQDFQTGFNELKVKLPLLVLPLVLFTSKLPSKAQIETVLKLFVTACVLGIIIGVVQYSQLDASELINKRQLSTFISHIRFGLMLDLAFFILAYSLISKRGVWSHVENALCVIVMALILWFMVILESVTAYIAFAAVLLVIPLYVFKHIKIVKYRLLILSGFTFMLLSASVYVYQLSSNYFHEVPWNYKTQTNRTLNNRVYAQHKDILYRENGHRVWNYICWEELQNEWPKRSGVSFDGLDNREQPIKYTILRYMTSKGLMKDSAGVHHLTQKDVENIEAGFTNYKYTSKLGLSRRVNQILRGVERYLVVNDANNSSAVMRWIYFIVGAKIAKNNPIIGVGTGDIIVSYKSHYQENNYGLEERFQGLSHNQFLTTSVALGIIGLLSLLVLIGLPLWHYKTDFLLVVFTIIIVVSFVTDNTLTRQAGVTLYAFFASMLIIRKEQAELPE